MAQNDMKWNEMILLASSVSPHKLPDVFLHVQIICTPKLRQQCKSMGQMGPVDWRWCRLLGGPSVGVSCAMLPGSRLQFMESGRNFLNTEHMNAFTADLTHRDPLCRAGAPLNRLIQTTQPFTSHWKNSRIPSSHWTPTHTIQKNKQFHKLSLTCA